MRGPRRYHYLADPVFLAAAALYLLNRLLLRPMEGPHGGFFHSYGNSLLCIPFCLPPCLLAFRALGLRRHDRMPSSWEVGLHLAIWSVYFKGIATRIPAFSWVVPDPWDVAGYAAGALAAAIAWSAAQSRSPVHRRTEAHS